MKTSGAAVAILAILITGSTPGSAAQGPYTPEQLKLLYVDSQGQPLARAEDNEIFQTDREGRKRVLEPPLPIDRQDRPMKFTGGQELTQPDQQQNLMMFETQAGLIECTNLWRRSCRRSTYGTYKHSRTWIVLRKGLWWECDAPSRKAYCVLPALNGSKDPKPVTRASDLPWISGTVH